MPEEQSISVSKYDIFALQSQSGSKYEFPVFEEQYIFCVKSKAKLDENLVSITDSKVADDDCESDSEIVWAGTVQSVQALKHTMRSLVFATQGNEKIFIKAREGQIRNRNIKERVRKALDVWSFI